MLKKRYATLNRFVAGERLTQRALAAKLGVSAQAVSLYLKGQRIPEPAIALKLAKLSGVPLEALLSKKKTKVAA